MELGVLCHHLLRTSSKRGKSHPSGSSATRREDTLDMTRVRKMELEAQAEKEVAECAERIEVARASAPLPPIPVKSNTSEALSRRIAEDLATIEKVLTKSSNLKGTFKKALKLAHDDIVQSVAQLEKHTVSEETRLLQ
ncbi:unnamed protein product [Colias eurytheme]|nr:unnamed protein product [Colias eurytheme]